jgi:hypothetical protein
MWIFLSFAVETAADHGFAGINQRAGPDMSISADLMESWKVSVYHRLNLIVQFVSSRLFPRPLSWIARATHPQALHLDSSDNRQLRDR